MGYNGQAPGPLLRMREGVPVQIHVINRTRHPEVVHWHGLHIPSNVDGATEEGSPCIAPGESLLYSFTPNPSGSRWYHTMAMQDLNRAASTGQYGFLYIEPKSGAGRYDQEVFLAVHHWEPSFAVAEDTWRDCPNISYRYASFNDKLLSATEPLRVRPGQRVLFHFLNASATEDVLLSLPGHRFQVIALDGNPVPRSAPVEVLSLAVGERVDAIVEMHTPGKWILGSTSKSERDKGLGLVVEYANATGQPQWITPTHMDWSYSLFSAGPGTKTRESRHLITMVFAWNTTAAGVRVMDTINGEPSHSVPPLKVHEGEYYRLRLVNATGSAHSIHLPRHNFELRRVAETSVSGIMKDTVLLPRYGVVDVDLHAGHPGPMHFHCNQQLQMNHDFMQMIHRI
jgi:FtsP/CotA-like multicopper oxidase with cupredoxin domain